MSGRDGQASPLGALLSRACRGAGAGGAGGAAAEDEQARREREAAFAELVRLVMIMVRAQMGRRLRDHRESADVCQSVARSFVDDFEAGRVGFESEAHLAGYLQRVVQSKLADLARHDGAAKRGGGEVPARTEGLDESRIAAGGAAGASAVVRMDEARRRVEGALSAEEQELVRLRGQGLNWDQIARALGKDAAALRQQWSRMQKRVGGGDDAA